jgi:DNA repair protein RecO
VYLLKMYAIHTTEGIVLGVFENGEVDNFYYVYTKEYGLLGVLATGVRMNKSKFRYTLQPFSRITLGFVKGKAALRLVHCELISRAELTIHQRMLAKLFERLRRLVNGEEKNEDLYTVLTDAFLYLTTDDQKSEKELYSVELLYTVRLLNSLGYWASSIEDIPFLWAPISTELCTEIYEKRRSFLPRIEHALSVSQL